MMYLTSLRRLEEIKAEIRSTLISLGSRDVTLPKLNATYKSILDINIPFQDFNYTSLRDFLNNMPDVVSLKYNEKKELCAYHIDTNKSKHISDLVIKEKRKSSFDNGKVQKHYNNYIDPHLLNEVLLECMTVSKQNRKISKNHVLSSIKNRIGLYSFYSMKNLNNQLYELHHILTQDEENIYLKEIFFKNNYEKEKAIIIQEYTDSNIDNLVEFKGEIDYQNMLNVNDKTSTINLVGKFVKDSTKSRLQKLIKKYPNGIWCSELPSIYCHEYKLDLEYKDLGFNSIIEFVNVLPDIMQTVRLQNNKKILLVDAKLSKRYVQYLKFKILLTSDSNKHTEKEKIHIEPIPIKLSSEISKTFIPQNVMNINETIDQITVTSLFTHSKKYLDVIISECYSPSFFWVVLKKNRTIINQLMSKLQEFYNNQNLECFRIPEIIVQVGLHVACTYDNIWHRGVIIRIKPVGFVVFFYDYGTIKTYSINDLFFLNKIFSAVHAQAICCSLYNIKPNNNIRWSKKTIKTFRMRILEKNFRASIHKINEQKNTMLINIIDVSDNANNIHINEWMVIKQLAEWSQLPNTKKNFNSKYYQECIQKKENDLLHTKYMNPKSVSENNINDESSVNYNCIQHYISFNHKLEALRTYKDKFF